MAISVNTLTKMFVVMLLIGGIFTSAQAATGTGQMTIGATIAANIAVSVADAAASQSWTLDPQNIFYQHTIANAINVKCNKGTWTLTATATHPKLTDGSNTLLSGFYVDATEPTSGMGYNWSSTGTVLDLWKDGGKGGMSTALKFTQPVSWTDSISSTYADVTTFTATVS